MIVYSSKTCQYRQKVQSALASVYPAEKTIFCSSLAKAFSRSVWVSVYNDICLLLLEKNRDFNSICEYQEQLLQCRLILVLPDKSEKTLANGCALHPIYMAEATGGLQDLQEVIKKITGNAAGSQGYRTGF